MNVKHLQMIVLGGIAILLILISLFCFTKSEYYDTPHGQFQEQATLTCLNGSLETKRTSFCQYIFATHTSAYPEIYFGAARNTLRSSKHYPKLELLRGDLYPIK